MSFTLEDVIDAALSDNQEVDFSWADRSDWVRWANDAIFQISEFSALLRGTQTVTLVEDQQEYNLGDDVIRVKRVTWSSNGEDSDGDKIFRRGRNINDRWGQTDDIRYDILRGESDFPILFLAPAPGSTEDGDDILVEYVKRHSEVSDDDDTINFPVELKTEIVDYMNYRFSKQDDELQKADFELRNWRNGIRRTVSRIKNRAEPSMYVDGMANARQNYRKRY